MIRDVMQMRREDAKREQHYQDAFKRHADIARADLLERLRQHPGFGGGVNNE
jgi:serine/threonine protein kinase HipA of HipAB toxin-antitoxin module